MINIDYQRIADRHAVLSDNHVIVGRGTEVRTIKRHRLVALTFYDPLRGLPGALFPLPFNLDSKMHSMIIFVLPFLLAGQGMIHSVLTGCCDVTYV